MIERLNSELDYIVKECYNCGNEKECRYVEYIKNKARYFCKDCAAQLKKLRGEEC